MPNSEAFDESGQPPVGRAGAIILASREDPTEQLACPMNRLQSAFTLSALVCLPEALLCPADAAGPRPAEAAAQTKIATFAAIQEQLSHTGALAFTLTLQDADDEDKIVKVDLVVQVTDVAADPGECRLSYRERVQKSAITNDQSLPVDLPDRDQSPRVDLRDVETVRTAAFESYENEWEAIAGFVYTYTTPQVTTVLLVHPNHAVNWIAFADADTAKRVAEEMTQALKLCNPSGGAKK
jgi:hypothetical protein